MRKDNLKAIREKIDVIGFGLLRFRENDRQVSIQVKAKCTDVNAIHCLQARKEEMDSLTGRQVSFVQKDKDDYLYIAGRVEKASKKNPERGLIVRIIRACWFVKKSKGTISWLQEKHIFDLTDKEVQALSA
jgi:hypothetical protein